MTKKFIHTCFFKDRNFGEKQNFIKNLNDIYYTTSRLTNLPQDGKLEEEGPDKLYREMAHACSRLIEQQNFRF